MNLRKELSQAFSLIKDTKPETAKVLNQNLDRMIKLDDELILWLGGRVDEALTNINNKTDIEASAGSLDHVKQVLAKVSEKQSQSQNANAMFGLFSESFTKHEDLFFLQVCLLGSKASYGLGAALLKLANDENHFKDAAVSSFNSAIALGERNGLQSYANSPDLAIQKNYNELKHYVDCAKKELIKIENLENNTMSMRR